MFLTGTLLVLENYVDGYNLCHIGSYPGDKSCQLKVKFWNTSIQADSLIWYSGIILRVKDGKSLTLDIKSYYALPFAYPPNGMELNSILTIHGKVESPNTITSNTWHGSELKLWGNFKTPFKSKVL
jgi:hypothetical protein